MKNLVLVGQPNSGKTSLFNKLTGLNQKVGNYAGVTVEKKYGTFRKHNVIDIPGLRSLDTTSPEEVIAKNQILHLSPSEDVILFVSNGMQMAKSLMLFSQLADLQIPLIFVVNFWDEMLENDHSVDQEKLQLRLGCPIVVMNSKTGEGVETLATLIKEKKYNTPIAVNRSLHDVYTDGIYENSYKERLSTSMPKSVHDKDYGQRLKFASDITKNYVHRNESTQYLGQTKKWDKYLLHPVYGLLIFLLVLFVVFQAMFSLSSYPMDWIDQGVGMLSEFIKTTIPHGWVQDLLADALIPGIGGVIIFIPQIAILFFLLGVLEHSGYLSRISFISDAFLRRFGLSGHSVVPLMSSWACAIPAIMSTRIITNPKERLAVILASPLMTCSARLPVYAILIAILFPKDAFWGASGLMLMGLYLLGLVATLIVSWVVSKYNTSEQEDAYWVLELPIFRTPNWRNIWINVYQKTKSFVLQAGKIILTISIVLWVLSTFSPHDRTDLDSIYTKEHTIDHNITQQSVDLEYSYLGYMGKFIEPAIQPLGYDWKIGIGLLTSFAAREVFVGTLATIYSVESEEESTIIERMQRETIKGTDQPRYSWATSISLLLFYVFAMQCMSTLAIVRKETGSWKYPMIQLIFMSALAYISALLAYQVLS